MRAVRIQPEDRAAVLCCLTLNRQFDPVLDGRFAGRGHTPDIARLNLMAHQHRITIHDAHSAARRHLERGRVRAIFFGLLGHQAHVLHRARCGRVQRAGFFEVINRFGIDARIAAVGDHASGVVFLAIRAPALAACTDHCRHRGVDDDIGRHMQVGDAFIGIHHVKRRTTRENCVDLGLDLGAVGQLGDLLKHGAQTAIRINASGFKIATIFVEHRGQILAHAMAKDDRIRYLHHRRLHMQRIKCAFGSNIRNCLIIEGF